MKVMGVAVAALLVVSLGACGTSGEESDATAGSNRPDASSGAAEPDVPDDAGNGTLKFGATITYDDGLAVTVAEPTPFTPSEYAAPDPAPAYLAFQVTIVNGTAANYDLTYFHASAQSADVEADDVFDSANGFSGSGWTPLLPGKESTFKIGFGVADPADVVMGVSPGFDYVKAIFTT